jgi:hypothetical protein
MDESPICIGLRYKTINKKLKQQLKLNQLWDAAGTIVTQTRTTNGPEFMTQVEVTDRQQPHQVW